MTKEKFMKLFGLFSYVVANGFDDVLSFSPSAHLIDHCGGYELELHPSALMWEHDMICLCAMAEKLCLAVECRFYDGSIIIR